MHYNPPPSDDSLGLCLKKSALLPTIEKKVYSPMLQATDLK